jgi:DNA (cytosine-5)-methyltransferase 1
LFDGIGGFILPTSKYNIKTLWTSEIDSNCNKLIHNKFYNLTQYGDITKVSGYKIEPVDIISFGSPCNNLSLAGNRKGFDGDKSVLFYEAIRIINEMRESTNGEYPKFIIWENVVGALSSNVGNDFKRVLEEITKTKISIPRSNKWSRSGMVRANRCNLEWRVFNSQYWRVPHSRERIFLVADFRTNRGCCGEILFEQRGLSRDTSKSKNNEETTSPIMQTALERQVKENK